MPKEKLIFSISPFIAKPLVHGSVARIYHLNKALAEKHRVFFSHRKCNNPENDNFLGEKTLITGRTRIEQIFSPIFLFRACKIIKRERIDYILSNHIWSGLSGLMLKFLTGLPLVFDNHNVEYIRFRRMGSFFWPLIWLLEKWICTVADQVLCVSRVDRESLIRGIGIKPEKIQVVENGFDINILNEQKVNRTAFRAGLGMAPDDFLFLFFGSYTYPPNVKAVRIIIDEILPRMEKVGIHGQIALIGGGPCPIADQKERNISIKVFGFVNDLKLFIQSADVMIAPLTAGSGTRLKILETIAIGTPVVTTAIGAEGIDTSVCGDKLRIHNNWEDFAHAAAELAKSPRSPSPNGFAEKYEWAKIITGLQLPSTDNR